MKFNKQLNPMLFFHLIYNKYSFQVSCLKQLFYVHPNFVPLQLLKCSSRPRPASLEEFTFSFSQEEIAGEGPDSTCEL